MLSNVWLFATPWTVAHQAPLSVGILQAGILEWVAMPFSRRSQPRDRTQVSHTVGGLFTIWASSEASVMVYNPLYTLLDLVCLYFVENFCVYIHEIHWSVVFCFGDIFVWFCCQGNTGLIEWVLKNSLLFYLDFIFFLESASVICIFLGIFPFIEVPYFVGTVVNIIPL